MLFNTLLTKETTTAINVIKKPFLPPRDPFVVARQREGGRPTDTVSTDGRMPSGQQNVVNFLKKNSRLNLESAGKKHFLSKKLPFSR